MNENVNIITKVKIDEVDKLKKVLGAAGYRLSKRLETRLNHPAHTRFTIAFGEEETDDDDEFKNKDGGEEKDTTPKEEDKKETEEKKSENNPWENIDFNEVTKNLIDRFGEVLIGQCSSGEFINNFIDIMKKISPRSSVNK
jgi:hypothetical protein